MDKRTVNKESQRDSRRAQVGLVLNVSNVLTIIAMAVGGFIWAKELEKEVTTIRVKQELLAQQQAVIERHQGDRLQQIEAKIDKLEGKIDRLVEGARR